MAMIESRAGHLIQDWRELSRGYKFLFGLTGACIFALLGLVAHGEFVLRPQNEAESLRRAGLEEERRLALQQDFEITGGINPPKRLGETSSYLVTDRDSAGLAPSPEQHWVDIIEAVRKGSGCPSIIWVREFPDNHSTVITTGC